MKFKTPRNWLDEINLENLDMENAQDREAILGLIKAIQRQTALDVYRIVQTCAPHLDNCAWEEVNRIMDGLPEPVNFLALALALGGDKCKVRFSCAAGKLF